MRISYRLHCLLFLAAFCLTGEKSWSQQITFQRSFDASMIDLFGNTGQTSDGGYFIVGEATGFNLGAELLKTDSTGSLLWAKQYGSSLFTPYFANHGIETSDNGFIMTGSHSPLFSSNQDVLLIKTDASGNLTWAKRYDAGSNEDGGNYVMQTTDGGYLVAGIIDDASKDTSNIYVMKTDGSGNFSWGLEVKLSPDGADVGSAAEEVSDGYVFAGHTTQIFGVDTMADIVLFKTDFSGNLQWINTYGDDMDVEQAAHIREISTGELLVTGNTDKPTGFSDIFLMKTDGLGNVNWSTSYALAATLGDFPYSVEETSDNGYVMAGFSLTFPAAPPGFLLKTNSAGAVQFAQQYPMGIGALLGRGNQTSDGGYILGSTGGVSGWNLHIVKTDANGVSSCNENATTAVQNAYAPAPVVPAITSAAGGSSASVTPPVANITPVDSLYCLAAPCTPPPAPTLTATDVNVCESETGVTYTTQAGYDAYTWTVTGGSIASGQGTNSITVDWGTGPAGTVDLVIDSSGCAGNLSTENVSVANPAPTLTATDVSVCEGETGVTYTTQAGFSTYTWTIGGGSIASGSGTNSITVDWGSPGAGTVDLTVVDTYGCTGSLTATESVTVNSNPTPTLTATDTVVCESQAGVTYTTQAGYSTYTWTVSGGSIASGAGTESITVNWATPGGGTVDLTVVDASGCSGSLSTTETITINPNPNPSLTTTDTAVCENQAGVIFTTESFYSSYAWTVSGGSISSGAGTDSINVDWGSPGGGTVDLTVTDTNGCSGSLSSTESVSINAAPAPTLTVTDTAVCENESGLTYTTQAGYTTYTWTVTGGTIASGAGTNSITVNWGISGSGSVDLTVVDANGCSGSLSVAETVTIYASPTANITPAGSTSFCTGDSVELQSDTAITYLWLLDSAATGLTSQGIFVTTPGNYQVVVSGSTGCPDTSAITVVTENPSPSANITALGPTVFCAGDSVTLQADTASIYAWFLDGSFTGQTSQTITVFTGGDYQVAISNAFCQDTSAAVTVTVNPGPVIDLASVTVDSSSCGNSDGSITGVVATGTAPLTYEWTNSSGTAVGGDSLNLMNVPADTYTLLVFDSIGCTVTDNVTINDIGAPAVPVAGADAGYCQGEAIADLTASGSGGTLVWYSDPLLADSIGTGSPFASGATGTDTFYVAETVAGCTGPADMIIITVNPTPAAPAAGTDSAYCQGEPVADLTAFGSGGTMIWYSDSLLTDSVGTGSPFTSGATATATFYVTETVAGCEGPPDAVTVTVLPTPAGLVTGGGASYCPGDVVADLTAIGSGGNITWYSDAGLTDTVFTGSPFNSGATGDTTFYVTETMNGCASAADSVSITFYSQPVVALTSSADTVCAGGSVTLTATGAGSYIWSTGDTGSTITVNPVVLTSFTVTGSANGCLSLPISVAVVADSSLNPTVAIDAGPGVSICQGGSVTLSASGADAYLWSTGDTAAAITVSPAVSAVYSVVGTTNAGCTGAAASTLVTVNSGSITAGFTANPISGSIPLTVSFTDTSAGAVAWQWDFSYDSLFFDQESILQNPDYTYTTGGIMVVLLVAADANGCTDSASMTLNLEVREEVFIPNLFTPNGDGSNDVLYVRGNGIDNLLLVIYDRWGEKVYEGTYDQVWALEDTYPAGVGWDGTYKDRPMNPAVFVYVLKGSFLSGEVIDQKGNITLVR